MLNYRLLTAVTALMLSACTITGPADDGYENNHEWVDNGRLLSDETKLIYSSKASQGDASTTPASNSTDTDFTAYKQWQDAKNNNTPEYQKFLQWQEFEAFQQWKQQKNTE